MRILIAASLALAASAGATLAQATPVPPAPAATSPPGVAASTKPATPAEAARAAKVAADEVKAECMRLWDKGTHMSRQEWSRTCDRIQTRLDNLKIENLDVMGLGMRKKQGAGKEGSVKSPGKTN